MSFSNESYSDYIESSITLLDYDSLNAPSNLILDIQDYNIYLSWQDNSSQEDGFRIDRKIGDEEWEENYQIVSPNVTFFNDEDLQIIDNCSYRVAAFIDDSYSNFIEGDIDFYCRDLYSMSSLINGQISINPYEPFNFVVELLDAYGELVIGDYEVWFQFTTCPDGMSINNQVFGVGDSLSVLSSNGLASVNLYAGSEPGTASIKASAVNAQNMSGSVIKSNIVVYAVLPENIYLDHGGINSGQDMGGGVWQIEVAAIIEDGYGNPGIYGTTVWFSLEDAQIPGMDPDWAIIGAEAYIGNENANGDSLAGVAYTYLNYEGSHTNDSLWVHIQVALPNGYLEETKTMIVPLQFGDLEIIASCDSIAWTPNTIEDSLSTNFTILLRDGQNNPINNQQVYFIGSPGHPVDMGTDNDNNAFTELTGISPNTNGHVNKDWTFFRYECPPPVGNEPGTSAATIYIIIPGADVEEELNVTLYRYP